jgi:hypothetical protein
MERKTGKLIGGLVLAVILCAAGCGGGGADADISSGGGTGITNIFSSPAEMGVGDIMPIEFLDSEEVVVDFEGVSSSAEFILVLGNAAQGGYGSNISTATSESAPVELPETDKGLYEEPDLSAQEVLSSWMRAVEMDFSVNEPVPEGAIYPSASKAMADHGTSKDVSVGDHRTFRVLDSLSSTTSYTSTRAQVACIGDNIIMYVDSPRISELTDSEISQLCNDFDEDIAYEQSLYGDLSDVDGNGKLIVLSTYRVNELGSLGGGVVTGFFFPSDLYPNSGSNPVSNYGEIIYTMVPDPSGKYGVAISNAFAMENLIPSVLVHEAQHAISYNQHVFVQGGQAEESWLNEALSHFTEDIMGYGRENPSRVAMYLASPSTAGLVTQGSPNLLERGASYLFMRFMYEQSGKSAQFLRSLYTSNLTGVDNLESAFDGESGFAVFSQFMARWSVAVAVSGRGITQDARYTYADRAVNSATGNWEGVCLMCDAEDGRGTVLEGVSLNPFFGYHSVALDSSALKFFEIATIPPEITFTGGQNDFGILIRSM